MSDSRTGTCSRHILCIVAARPNFMKMAPVMRALADLTPALRLTLVHTGQHYDRAMNAQFCQTLGLPEAAVNLGVGAGSHAAQTALVMQRFEPVLTDARAAAVLVVGDVNSSLACALVAAKQGVPVLHVEAGLRSFDRTMPEEFNRILIDQLSELLLTSEPGARANLLREAIPPERIHFVGNVMIDSLFEHLARATPTKVVLEQAGHAAFLGATQDYGVLTLHRPSNVDRPDLLRPLLDAMVRVSERLPLIFPVHPRTRAMLEQTGLFALIDSARILALDPQGYLEMLGLMRGARVVLTDSGGIQEETTALGVPCLTLRENTERPITVTSGTNTIAGTDPERIVTLCDAALQAKARPVSLPELWDGHAARRIAAVIGDWIDHVR